MSVSFAAGLFAFACAEREVQAPAWPAGLDLGVVVHVGAQGFEILGVAAFEDGRPLRPGLSAGIEEASSGHIEVLGWSKEDLLERVPELDPESWWQVGAERIEPGCTSARAIDDGSWSLPLPALEPSTFVLRDGDSGFVQASPSPLNSQLALRIPGQHVDCHAASFTDAAQLDPIVFPPGAVLLGRAPTQPLPADLVYRQILSIDATRILIQSYAGLFLFSRTSTYADSPAERIAADELPARAGGPPGGPRWSWSGIAVAHRNVEGVVDRIFASASHGSVEANTPRGGGIFEIEIGEAGFLRPIRTSTSYDLGPGPGAIASAEDGGFVAVGAQGTILRKAPNESSVQVGVVEPKPWFRQVLVTPIPELRHVAGAETGHLAFGDFYEHFEDVESASLREVATAVTGLAFVPGRRPRIAVGTYSSGLWQLGADRSVEPLRFRMTAGASCTSVPDACGLLTVDRSELASAPTGELVVSAGRCEDLIAVDVARRCARRLPVEVDRVLGLDLREGRLTIIGQSGRIVELRLAD